MAETSDQRKFNKNRDFHAPERYQAQRTKTTEKAISTLESSQS
jgi:hypothetical protein